MRDLITATVELLQRQTSGECAELLTLDFRDAVKQLHVVPSERPLLAGPAMDHGPLVWYRMAAWVMRSTQAWLGAGRAQKNCFVDDPIIALRETTSQRRRLAMGCCSGGGSFGPEALCIGTHFTVKSVVNKAEVSFPAKKNAEILVALKELMDNARGMVRHADIRKLAGKESWVAGILPQLKPFVRQLWASLYKDWTDKKVELVYKRQAWPTPAWPYQEHQQVLVRHLFLVDRLLDGPVLEVDASTTGGGAACWIGEDVWRTAIHRWRAL